MKDKFITTTLQHGRTTVPAAIRADNNVKAGDRLIWIDDGQIIRVIPVSPDSIQEVAATLAKRTQEAIKS